jgi:DNA repair exonuclease SbcCD ATPase subunit
MSDDMGIRERVTRHGEEAIGKLASELLENPMVSGALSAAFETRERALRAQEAAMGALNLPSASDLERLTRRLRGVSQRLEGIEDGLDRLEQRLDDLNAATALDRRLSAIEERLERIEASVQKAARPARSSRSTKAASTKATSRNAASTGVASAKPASPAPDSPKPAAEDSAPGSPGADAEQRPY